MFNARNVLHQQRHSRTQLEYGTARRKISCPTHKMILINLLKRLDFFYFHLLPQLNFSKCL